MLKINNKFKMWLLLFVTSVASAAPTKQSNFDMNEFARVPMQHGGRIKPFDSFARESVLFVTGSRKFQQWDPVALLLSWMSEPQEWQTEKFIRIGRKDVKRQLGLSEDDVLFSPEQLLGESFLLQYADEVVKKTQVKGMASKETPRDQELRRTIEKISLFQSIVSGEGLTLVPRVAGAWTHLNSKDSEAAPVVEKFQKALQSFHSQQFKEFVDISHDLRTQILGQEFEGKELELERRLSIEVSYNRMRPFFWAWMFYLVTFLVFVFFFVTQSELGRKVATSTLMLALGIHVVGFILRMYISGRPPVSNMYESVVWVSFGAVVFALILYYYQRFEVLLAVGAAIGCLGLIVADSAPSVMDSGINPLVPVLRSNLWLTVHVLTITLGYAAFALALGLANVSLVQFLKKAGQTSVRITQLNHLTYRAMQFGVVLLAAGTLLGGVWADYSWGRFWGWDPKEVWALIALLGYIAILHARYVGWIGQFGFATASIISFLLVVMAWYGVNFVLGVGLHSYGFSSGGQGTVALVCGAQLVWVIVVAVRAGKLKLRKRKSLG